MHASHRRRVVGDWQSVIRSHHNVRSTGEQAAGKTLADQRASSAANERLPSPDSRSSVSGFVVVHDLKRRLSEFLWYPYTKS